MVMEQHKLSKIMVLVVNNKSFKQIIMGMAINNKLSKPITLVMAINKS